MLLRAMCTLLGRSGLAADRYVNTFYFTSIGAPFSELDIGNLGTALANFYNNDVVVGATPRGLWSFLNTATLQPEENLIVKFYDMADAQPRIPLATAVLEVQGNSNGPLPHEVAICMSYKGTATAGIPAGRRRGRLYFGPLNVSALDAIGTTGECRPTPNLTALLPILGQQLKTQASQANAVWCIHSPTTGPLAAVPITSVGCDNAWDTQRRRGLEPTTAVYVPLT